VTKEQAITDRAFKWWASLPYLKRQFTMTKYEGFIIKDNGVPPNQDEIIKRIVSIFQAENN